jgi:hypothetical protein
MDMSSVDTVKLVTYLMSQKFRYVRSHEQRVQRSGLIGAAYFRTYDPDCHIFLREGRGFSCVVTIRHFVPRVNYGDAHCRFHFSGRKWQFLRRALVTQFESDDVNQFILQVTDWLLAGAHNDGGSE